jgi:hypothetical protein
VLAAHPAFPAPSVCELPFFKKARAFVSPRERGGVPLNCLVGVARLSQRTAIRELRGGTIRFVVNSSGLSLRQTVGEISHRTVMGIC